MSRVFVEDGRKVYIALDVLGFPVMGRLRATFRTFYIVDYRPRPISPASTQFPSTKLAWTDMERLIFSSHDIFQWNWREHGVV